MEDFYDDSHTKIYELLDGELSASQSSSVFAALAQNESLRLEFNEVLRLTRHALLSRSNSTLPEPNVESIFEKAGLRLNAKSFSVASIAPALSSSSAALSTLWSTIYPYVATALLSSVCSLMVASSLYTSSGSNFSASTDRDLSASSKTEFSTTSKSEFSTTSSSLRSQAMSSNPNDAGSERGASFGQRYAVHLSREGGKRSSVRETMTYESTPTVALALKDSPNETTSTADEDRISVYESQPISRREGLMDESPQASSNSLAFVSVPRLVYQECPATGFSLNLRRFVGLGYIGGPSPLADDLSSSSNCALALSRPVGLGQEFGIELGQEELMDAHEARAEGKLRFASITYATALFRYELDPTFYTSSTHPYVQVGLGASQLGALLKLSTGIDYSPIQGVSVQAAVESTLAQYLLRSKVHCSSKTGLSVGLRFSL